MLGLALCRGDESLSDNRTDRCWVGKQVGADADKGQFGIARRVEQRAAAARGLPAQQVLFPKGEHSEVFLAGGQFDTMGGGLEYATGPGAGSGAPA